jgi:hypothetical protein
VSDQDTKYLLYYRTREQIEAYRKVPVEDKFARLQAQMEFFHKTMPEQAKRIRERIIKGKSP